MRPSPLKTYTLLFGPDIKNEVSVQADIFASESGRTYPSFGIGSHGISGLQLQFAKNRRGGRLLLVYNENQILTSAKCEWKNMAWCTMKLRVEKQSTKTSEGAAGKSKDTYVIKGKCWTTDQSEPDWQITYTGEIVLDDGQSSIIGIPYSGTDIFYDNLIISKPQ